MKLGIVADIHNNVVALYAVLKVFDNLGCEKILCAGDIIGIGPYPEETVQQVKSIPDLLAVRGNHEKYLLEGIPSEIPNSEGMGHSEMEHHRWEHSLLTKSSVDFLSGLPNYVRFNVFGKKIVVMHYGMNQRNEYMQYMPNPTARDLRALFPEPDDIVIYGHDHTQTICQYRNRWFINSGSLGCPGKDRDIARAALLEITPNGHVAVQSVKVTYNVSAVLEDIERLKYPAYAEIKRLFFGGG
ncbi:MAG: metallophosphoesterase family protein [Clostridia bacterium]